MKQGVSNIIILISNKEKWNYKDDKKNGSIKKNYHFEKYFKVQHYKVRTFKKNTNKKINRCASL